VEKELFKTTLQSLTEVLVQTDDTRFFLISSIGGLFEGQNNITSETHVRPMRPYGHLKMEQEQLIATQLNIPSAVFRLPSVYSFINPNKRTGLIQTMAMNGLMRQTTSIFGSPSTLRDYVWADDIADSLIRFCEAEDISSKPYHFFTGRPISILHIQASIERVLRRPIQLSFEYDPSNTLNICGNAETYGGFWKPSGLTQNIKSIISQHLQKTA
jgi:nucleoside-diphosphate-sugar epimerase